MFKFSSQSPFSAKKKKKEHQNHIFTNRSQTLWGGGIKIISKSMFGFEVEEEKKKKHT